MPETDSELSFLVAAVRPIYRRRLFRMEPNRSPKARSTNQGMDAPVFSGDGNKQERVVPQP